MAKVIELIPIKDLDLSDLDYIGGEVSPNEDESEEWLVQSYGCGVDGCDNCTTIDVYDKDGNYLYSKNKPKY